MTAPIAYWGIGYRQFLSVSVYTGQISLHFAY